MEKFITLVKESKTVTRTMLRFKLFFLAFMYAWARQGRQLWQPAFLEWFLEDTIPQLRCAPLRTTLVVSPIPRRDGGAVVVGDPVVKCGFRKFLWW